MPVNVLVLTYQYRTTVIQLCASTLKILGRGKIQTSSADDLWSKTQMLPWHSVFSPSQVFMGNDNNPVELQLRHKLPPHKRTSDLFMCYGIQISAIKPQWILC